MKNRWQKAVTAVLVLFIIASVAYALARESRTHSPLPSAASASGPTSPTPATQKRTIAYYFHGHARCQNCRKIEAYTAETLKDQFAEPLRSGALEWKVLNVEETANRHFIQEYRLTTKSVVLVQMDQDTQLKWKNLEGVWNYLDNKDGFSKYIQSEVTAYLKGM